MLNPERASLFSFSSMNTSAFVPGPGIHRIALQSPIVPAGYHWLVKNWSAVLYYEDPVAIIAPPAKLSGLYIVPTGAFQIPNGEPVNMGSYLKVPLNDPSLAVTQIAVGRHFGWLQMVAVDIGDAIVVPANASLAALYSGLPVNLGVLPGSRLNFSMEWEYLLEAND